MPVLIQALKYVKDDRGVVRMGRVGIDGARQVLLSVTVLDVPIMRSEDRLAAWWEGVEQEVRAIPDFAQYVLDLPVGVQRASAGIGDVAVIVPIPQRALTVDAPDLLDAVVPEIKHALLAAIRREAGQPGPRGLDW